MKLFIIALLLLITLVGSYSINDDTHVIDLENKKDLEWALQEFPYLLIFYYKQGCSHCQNFRTTFDNVSKELFQHGIRAAKFNAGIDVVTSAKQKVKGFPTLNYYRFGKRHTV